ncbi:MAG: radical SAM protein [Candidatus Omnitrophica bacterium]|nr:radical SAM protein [Candidatus Omnitrophota bacterium]MDD5430161.1 radical SAM protein [Candidatus Omnitrophota bacterium]
MKRIRFSSIIVTYRCNARCQMCYTWKFPAEQSKEIGIDVYKRLPFSRVINVTGGEPFMREDLAEIIGALKKKTKRLVISSNGYFSDRIVKLFKKNKDIGIRISLEGMAMTNDGLRGLVGGFDKAMETIARLKNIGIKDLGIGMTVCDKNSKDIIGLYQLAKKMKLQFATAAIHNSFYFHKFDNEFEHPEMAISEFKKLINLQLKSRNVKDWFRAYFNYGLINYIEGEPRILPCAMGHDSFFLDPYGEVLPCNVMDETMGNLRGKSFEKIWGSRQAERVRGLVNNCTKNCWMVGSVSQQMNVHIDKPLLWILKHKFLKVGL